MSLVVKKCVVCGRTTNLFNYGVFSCNACKMFFRRVIFGTFPKFCKEKDCCSKKSPLLSKCRYCRFQICVQAGMMYTPSGNSIDHQHSDSLIAVINNLSYLDNQRSQKFQNFYVVEDPTMEELAETGSIRFELREKDFKMNMGDWGFMTAITAVDYMKKLNFVNLLGLADRKVFLKSTYFHFSIFASAMKSFQEKQGVMVFPDGTDVIPGDRYPISKKLENRIRCLLVGRLAELNVTNEEFLALGVLFFCNPALSGLSDHARAILASTQRAYSSTLLQHCLITYQQSGPSRFTDLLSLCHVINKTLEDMEHHFVLFKIYEPTAQYRKLFG